MARNSAKKRLSYIIAFLFLSVSLWFSFNDRPKNDQTDNSNGVLEVHFIDVGQADAILVEQGESAFLIDAGNNGDADLVLDYLEKQNIDKLEYVVGTHPHEDHIGGLDSVIQNFEVETVLMPAVDYDTDTYNDVISSLEDKELQITFPEVGQIYTLGKTELTILSPSKDQYSELNLYSIAIRLVYGNSSFLFLGDCESLNEKEMLKTGLTLDSDVIKLGHHGSDSSSSQEFLEAVTPEYAVISVGRNNEYKHPSPDVIERLEDLGTEVLRTDELGTIIFSTDGDTLTVVSPTAF